MYGLPFRNQIQVKSSVPAVWPCTPHQPSLPLQEDADIAESEDFEEIDAAFSVMPLSPEADELVRQADRITKEAHAVLEK